MRVKTAFGGSQSNLQLLLEVIGAREEDDERVAFTSRAAFTSAAVGRRAGR
jgi:hypothetical protein